MKNWIIKIISGTLCCIGILSAAKQAVSTIAPDPIIREDFLKVFSNPPRLEGYPFQALLDEAAKRYGLPLPYALAVVRGESFFDPKAKSAKGAIGLMQVLPSTAAEYGVKEEDLLDPEKNIDAGMHYLADLYAGLKDPYLALAAYYCGTKGVDRDNFTLRQDCNEYVKYIHSHLQKILSQAKSETPGTKEKQQHFVLAGFDNFLDAVPFMSFLSEKIPNLELDLFRREVVRDDHARYQYQVLVPYKNNKDKGRICRTVDAVTGFSFCK